MLLQTSLEVGIKRKLNAKRIASLAFSFGLYLIYLYPIPRDRSSCRRYTPELEKV